MLLIQTMITCIFYSIDMLKVSFKGTKSDPAKRVQRVSFNEVKVTLKGILQVPLGVIPLEMRGWIFKCKSIEFRDYTITVVGMATCNSEDEFNLETGARLAEARAKIKLYDFMLRLSKRLCVYYSKLLSGKSPVDTIYQFNKPSLNRSYNKYKRLLTTELSHLEKLLKES